MSDSIPYFLRNLQIQDDQYLAMFDFKPTYGNILKPTNWAKNSASGVILGASNIFIPLQKIYGNSVPGLNSNTNDQYGWSVTTNSNGTVLVMGGPFEVNPNDGQIYGAAFVYTGDAFNGFNFKQPLTIFDNQFAALYGTSVDINSDGSVIVIGAYGDDNLGGSNAGAAWVYTGNANVGWNVQQKLTGDSANDFFGIDVATNADGTVIIVGGYGDDDGGVDAGAALVYTGSPTIGWKVKQKLTGDNAGDQFGWSVATNNDGSILMMGGRFDDHPGLPDAGGALIYTGNENAGWSIKQKLSGSTFNSQFGVSVAMNANGNVLMMGGYLFDNNPLFNTNNGGAQVYTGNAVEGWKLKQILTGEDANDQFGISVATNADGTVLMMGGNGDDIFGVNVDGGSALIYTGNANNGWSVKQKVTDTVSIANGDQFGTSVSISADGSIVMIGGPFDDDAGINNGAAVIGRQVMNGFFENFPLIDSGRFDGNTLVKLNKPLTLGDNSTIFFSYSRQRNQDEILFSTIEGNSFETYSGFCVGINDANKLYFKYWNNVEGPFTFTFSEVLANQNLILLEKKSSVITLGKFNNNTLSFTTEDFEIKNNVFIESNNMFLGGTNNKPAWLNQNVNNFSGYMDYFYFINNIPSFYRNFIISGLVYDVSSGFVLTNVCYNTGFLSGSGFFETGITGYQVTTFLSGVNQITGYNIINSGKTYTGITGYQNISLGFFVDNCGNQEEIIFRSGVTGIITENVEYQMPLTGIVFITGYNTTPLIGPISGSQTTFVTGQVCEQILTETTILNPDPRLDSFSYTEVVLLKDISTGNDIVEIFTEPYKFENLQYNIDLDYDSLNNNFYVDSSIENPNNVLLFANGQALARSGFNILQSGYDSLIVPNFDYIISGRNVETNRFFDRTNYLFYDFISGNSWAIRRTGNIITVPTNNNYWIFKNGQKLIKNRDYILSGPTSITLTLDNGTEENSYIVKEIPDNFIYYSGNSGFFRLSGRFNNSCSQVYFNGIKQKINNNYIENSSFDLISGNFSEKLNQNIILDFLEERFYNTFPIL